jgi:hypothetical protein
VHEVTVRFQPTGAVPAANVESELIDALELIEDMVEGLAERFDVSEASIELAVTASLDGKLQLVSAARPTIRKPSVADAA